MKTIVFPLTMLIALPLGIAAHETRTPDTTKGVSLEHNQHRKHSTGRMRDPGASRQPDRVLEFAIVRGALGDEAQTVRVNEGEIVELRWSSDQALTLHMHGYDIEFPVAANAPAAMRVHAVKTGRFPILNHDGEPPNVLVYLEVLPR